MFRPQRGVAKHAQKAAGDLENFIVQKQRTILKRRIKQDKETRKRNIQKDKLDLKAKSL